MRIGLFPLEVGRQVGGLEVYETNLIRALAEVDQTNTYEVFCLDDRAPQLLQIEADNFRFHRLRTNRLTGVAWGAARAMTKARVDVFHATFVPPLFTSIPYVFTHHGSEVMERPDFYPFLLGLRMRFLFRRAFRTARMVVCVSDYVREYLEQRRGIAGSRLQTIHNGCLPIFQPLDRAEARTTVQSRYGLKDRYILTVGRIEPRKNPIRLLEAYDEFRRSVSTPPKLVFAGMKTWSSVPFDATVSGRGLSALVEVLGHVPHEDLPPLYRAADFAVFPSLWEGFGLPAVEAFATGTPLIASNSTSLPEICGDAAILVDPCSPHEIAGAMRRLHDDPDLRQKLSTAGRNRAGEFSWQRTARETVQAYRRAAEG
jgi:glycosyltransferase involved in cell wall biosynthesis